MSLGNQRGKGRDMVRQASHAILPIRQLNSISLVRIAVKLLAVPVCCFFLNPDFGMSNPYFLVAKPPFCG